MGYPAAPPASPEPLWKQWRSQFPSAERLVYCNHASVSPLAIRTAEAITALAADVRDFGAEHFDRWLACYQSLRRAAAKLLNASHREIALTKNTSEGISTIANGIRWTAADRIVCFREDFPANSLPWRQLESKGVRIEWCNITDPLDRIDEAAKGARLLAISFVQYLSGYRVGLEEIGAICKSRNCFFFVDAIQGMGVFPIDVRAAHIDALAADGHKWMTGPEGCGILYVRHEVQEEVAPTEIGWTNFDRYWDYNSDGAHFRPDAGRYECGTLNTIGCFGLEAALQVLLEAGVERVGEAVLALAARVAEGAGRKGYELLGTRAAGAGSGIVSFRKPGQDVSAVARALRAQQVVVAPRRGWLRASPHFYQHEEDIDRLVSALP